MGNPAAQRLESGQHVEDAAHADVVRDAAVDEVEIGTAIAVGERLELLQPRHGARGRPGRIRVVEEQLRPRRRAVAAGAAIVVDGDRRQDDRHRRRRRGGACQSHARQVGAQDVEVLGVEDEPGPIGQIRRADHDPRAVRPQVRVRRAVEQNLVVEVGRELRSPPAGGSERGPVRGAQRPGDELALDVALEEALLVDVEQLVAVQAVRQGCEASAGDPGDHVDRVEQADASATLRRALHVAQGLEHAVGERRRAGTTAREGQDDQRRVVLGNFGRPLDPVRLPGIVLADRRIDGSRCASAEQGRCGQECRYERPPVRLRLPRGRSCHVPDSGNRMHFVFRRIGRRRCVRGRAGCPVAQDDGRFYRPAADAGRNAGAESLRCCWPGDNAA